MIDVVYQSVKQRVRRQKNRRIPEPAMVMSDLHQAQEFALAGVSEGGLAVTYELILLKLLKVAPEEGRALDIACGSGVLLSKIARERPNLDFLGIDLSDNMLELAKENFKNRGVSNAHLQKMNMFDIDTLEKNSFDLVTFNMAMHHCDNEAQVIDLINKSLKLLKKDGVLFMFDINRPKSDRMAVWLANRYNKKSGDYYYQDSLNSYRAAFSFKEVQEILKKSDWKNYKHIEPPIGNFIQCVSTEVSPKKLKRKVSFQTFDQTVAYSLLAFLIGNL